MNAEKYNNKMDSLLQLPQFEKMEKKRKNAKHPVLKEEERITDILKTLKIQRASVTLSTINWNPQAVNLLDFMV